MMNKEEEIKVLFPDDIETITISKNDYDRLYGELTYENIKLKQRISKAIEILKLCNSQCSKEVLEILGDKE